MHDIWSARADAAEAAVAHRHLRRLWGIPGTELGVVAHPATSSTRTFGRWSYWWQAHLLDCAVDAAHRSPSAARRRRVVRLARSIRVRNLTGWTNRYFDDVAWLGLALQRADLLTGVRHPAAVTAITRVLLAGWSDDAGGGIPWRVGDDFRNAPANGPAGLLLARTGHLERAAATADWLHARLLDPTTGLVLDGWRPSGLERAVFTYNQGTVLALETELSDGADLRATRVHALVAAVAEHLADDDVLRTHGRGDGGLFSGILARCLALVALRLPGEDAPAVRTRTTATRLVLASARSVWAHRKAPTGHPVFSADWERAPSGGEGDLSVQLGAWMLLEAATRVCDR